MLDTFCAAPPPEGSGQAFAREGATMLATLLPDPGTHAVAALRIRRRSIALLASGNTHQQQVGFFLFGLAEAAEGAR